MCLKIRLLIKIHFQLLYTTLFLFDISQDLSQNNYEGVRL